MLHIHSFDFTINTSVVYTRRHNCQESNFHFSLKIVSFLYVIHMKVCLDSVDGEVTGYGLGGPGIEP
jgi:hypothetical protein